MDAPLSSPTQTQHPTFQNSYFAPSSSSTSSSAPTSAAPRQTQPQSQQQQYITQQAAPQPPKRTSTSGDNTSHFLQDFNLVAEAAKRAQMAVLMRDMEAVGI